MLPEGPEPPPFEETIDRLCAIGDAAMRTHALIAKLLEMTPDAAAELLHYIVEHAGTEKGKYCLALDCLEIGALEEHLGEAFLSGIYACSLQRGYDGIAGMLEYHGDTREITRGDVDRQLEEKVPSGVRIARAKTIERGKITRLLADTNPLVVRTLLKNPLLTESDVLKICSRRPVAADILREVYNDKKWIARYGVKKALILSPYCPPEIGMKLLHFIMEQDLALVAETSYVHTAVRDMAAQKLHSLSSGGGG